jgi:Tlde1 domain
MWTFHIKSGKIDHNGVYFSTGWSGHNVKDGVQGRNNPDAVSVKDIGSLPPGGYTAGKSYDSPHTGPLTIPLTPKPENEMYGRSDFKIHGWQIGTDPGDPFNPSSDGCIMQARPQRTAIDSSPDKDWEVVGE